MKKLFTSLMCVCASWALWAHEVGDAVYTRTAKYLIEGTNLVVNGTFTEGASGIDGWTSISETTTLAETFMLIENGGPNGVNAQQVLGGMNSLSHGMYQKVLVKTPGTYVVSFSVMGLTDGFTDLDLTGSNVNYINAYYNTDGALATATGDKNKTLEYGENGVGGGYQFSFYSDRFVEVTFAVEVPTEGYIIADFRGLADGIQIADVSCHLAAEVFDDRIATKRLEYIRKFLAMDGVEELEMHGELVDCMTLLESTLKSDKNSTELESWMENLELVWTEFLNMHFSNVLEYIPTTDGSSNTGNNSANWMKWTTKYKGLQKNYSGKAPWSWSTDRIAYNTVGGPITIQWQRKASGNWNNVMTLTATLDPGCYYWGVSAAGGMMTLNKERWVRSWANECANTQLFFNSDTTDIFVLDPAVLNDYVFQFNLEEEKEITLGIICNNPVVGNGFHAEFYSPVLYKHILPDALTPEQDAYLDAVTVQLESLKETLDVAYGYLDVNQTLLPWRKDTLQIGVTEVQALYDEWVALSQDEILAMQEEEVVLADTISKHGIKHLKDKHITPFVKFNAPLTDMVEAVDLAKIVLGERIYSSSTKKTELEAEISRSQEMYNTGLVTPWSQEVSDALVAQKVSLEAMVEAFKNAVVGTTIVDIDFGTQETPAVFVTHEDSLGTYYTVDGAVGSMEFASITGDFPYELGFNGTDSLGMLRVGNSEVIVKFEGAPMKETDIVNIRFDYYFGALTGKSAGYKLLSTEGDNICGLYCCMYNKTETVNTFALPIADCITSVGNPGDAAVAATKNKTSFDIVLDYGAKIMYCTTSNPQKGTYITEKIALPELTPAQFVVYSNYGNAGRRCWFDNLKIMNIPADAVEGGEDIETVRTNEVKDGTMYNLMGIRILKPVKGQFYIQDGRLKIGE